MLKKGEKEDNEKTEHAAGDITGNGVVDVSDLSELALFLIGDKDMTPEQQKAADVDCDGEVKLADLARLRQFLSKVTEAL